VASRGRARYTNATVTDQLRANGSDPKDDPEKWDPDTQAQHDKQGTDMERVLVVGVS